MTRGPTRLLIVDDDVLVISALSRLLSDLGQVRFALSGAEALTVAERSPPDLVLVDVEMPGMNGFELCARFKQHPVLQHAPVIFVTSHADLEREVNGLTVGGEDFIAKPFHAVQVLARVNARLRRKQAEDELRAAAHTDPLTGLHNRRHFDEVIEREWHRARRAGTPLSVLLGEIDSFKAFNDNYGHPEGDACLRRVAEVLREATRPADVVARYGGEEFVLLLPDTDVPGATVVADRVLTRLRDAAIPHAHSLASAIVSMSIGVAGVGTVDGAHTAEALLAAADRGLYSAKRQGRDRSVSEFLDPTPQAA